MRRSNIGNSESNNRNGRNNKRNRSFISDLISFAGVVFIALIVYVIFVPSDDENTSTPEQEAVSAEKVEKDSEEEYTGDLGVEELEEEYTGDLGVEESEEEYTGDLGVEESEDDYTDDLTSEYDVDYTSGVEDVIAYYLEVYEAGDINSLSDIIYPNSHFYKTQYDYMESLSDRGIEITVYSYDIEEIKKFGEDRYVAVVNESYGIENPKTGYKEVNQTSEYTVQSIQDGMYITNLNIKN